MTPTRDERAKGRTGYPEPNVDAEDTGIIKPGGAYRGDGSVRDPRNPATETRAGAGPSGPRGGAPQPTRRQIDRAEALEAVRGKAPEREEKEE